MKFITSSFSPNMIISNNFDDEWRELTEEEFRALIIDAHSCVGHEDIAEILNVKYNKEPIKARYNDILLYANMERGVLKFYCVRILEPLREPTREYEDILEMI